MKRITDEMLIAYADGELGPDDRAAVEAALAQDPALRESLRAQQALRERLGAYYGPVAEEEVPERFAALLEPKSEVVDFAAAREKAEARARLFAWPQLGAMAASLAVGVIAGQLAFSGGGPVAVEDGAMFARGRLAQTLDTQLASAQEASVETRVGLSFADAEGRFCRTFEAPAVSGIACREEPGWKLVMTAGGRGTGSNDYRQAGAPLLMEQAQAMMAGAPFDAAAEKAARDRGWRGD